MCGRLTDQTNMSRANNEIASSSSDLGYAFSMTKRINGHVGKARPVAVSCRYNAPV